MPLAGHSEGHCGVAVKTPGDGGWLLHAGDTYFTRREVDPVAPREPFGSGLFQRLRSTDNAVRRANVARLRALRRDHPEVQVFSAHCATEFEALAHAETPPVACFATRSVFPARTTDEGTVRSGPLSTPSDGRRGPLRRRP